MVTAAKREDDGTWILDPPGMLFVYEQGAFPMDTRDPDGVQRLAAYRGDPRAVLELSALRLPRTLRRTLPRRGYRLTLDRDFAQVVERCRERPGIPEKEIWLTPRLATAYQQLQRRGHAHSFEVWDGGRLVGGTFGIAIGRAHTLESMFHLAPDAGTAAVLAAAVRIRDAGYQLLDVQQRTDHTARLGAREMPESRYLRRLGAALEGGVRPLPLRDDDGPGDGRDLVARLRGRLA